MYLFKTGYLYFTCDPHTVGFLTLLLMTQTISFLVTSLLGKAPCTCVCQGEHVNHYSE